MTKLLLTTETWPEPRSLLLQKYPGWTIKPLSSSLAGARYEKIVVLMGNTESKVQGEAWMQAAFQAECRLPPGKHVDIYWTQEHYPA